MRLVRPISRGHQVRCLALPTTMKAIVFWGRMVARQFPCRFTVIAMIGGAPPCRAGFLRRVLLVE